jgi:transcription-repair coupling factor (superfamily II helicase)
VRFHIVRISSSSYRRVTTVMADTVKEAAAQLVAIYRARKTSACYVMRGPDGKRYSVADSEAICKEQQ